MKIKMAKPDNSRLLTLALGAAAIVFLILAILFTILFATKHCKKCDTCPDVSNQDNTNSFLAQMPLDSLASSYAVDPNSIVKTLTDTFQKAGYAIIHVTPLNANNNTKFAMGIVTAKTTDNADMVMKKIYDKTGTAPSLYDGSSSESPVCPNSTFIVTFPPPSGQSPGKTVPVTQPVQQTTNAIVQETTQPPTTVGLTTTSATTKLAPTTTTIQNPQRCASVVKDFVILVDLLQPSQPGVDKFGQITNFLYALGNDLNFGDTATRMALLGYDSYESYGEFYFTNNPETWGEIVDDIIYQSNYATNNNNEADFRLALDRINSFQFRPNVEKHILVLADHPAPYSNASFIEKIEKQYGYYFSAITPTSVKSVQAQFQYLLVTDEQHFAKNVWSYGDDFVDAALDFWIKAACGYTSVSPNDVPSQPTYMPPATKRPTTTKQAFASTTAKKGSTQKDGTVAPTKAPILNNTCQEIDLIFVLDRSQSIDPAIYDNDVKNFVVNIANKFTYKDETRGTLNYARDSVIQFTTIADITIALNDTVNTDRVAFDSYVGANVMYLAGGDTKIASGLNAAYDQFMSNPRTTNRVAILMTDGVDQFENDINDTETIEAAARLLTIVDVFMGVGIGEEGSMNMENLTALLGNKTQYAYDNINDAYNATFGVAAEIAKAYPCQENSCKAVVFLEEMTEVVGRENKIKFLESTLGISKIIHDYDSRTLFNLILYNNDTHENGLMDYGSFIEVVNNTIQSLIKYNIPEAGETDTKKALLNLQSYLEGSILKKNFVVMMGQTWKVGDYNGSLALARSLASYTDFYVIDTTLNIDHVDQEELFYTLVRNNYNRYVNDTNNINLEPSEIVAAFNRSLIWDVDNYTCDIPDIIPCSNYLDITFALYRSSNNNTQYQLNDIARNLNKGFTGATYFTKKTILRYGRIIDQTLPDLTYDDGLIEKIIDNTTWVNPESSAYDLPIKLAMQGFSTEAARPYAPKVIVYVMDSYPINDQDCANAANELQQYQSHDTYPFVFAITTGSYNPAIDSTCPLFSGIYPVNFQNNEAYNVLQYNGIVYDVCPIPTWTPCSYESPYVSAPTCWSYH